jgi:hypothetical protein
VKCEICTLLVQGLDEILRGNASVAQINATIFNLCGELPGSAKSFVCMKKNSNSNFLSNI